MSARQVVSKYLHFVLPVFALNSLLSFPPTAKAEKIVPASLNDQSPREEIRIKIFPAGSPPRACTLVSKNPAGIVEVDPALTAALQKLIAGIQMGDDKALLPMFHPQIKVTNSQIKIALSSISRMSGSKIDVSLLRAYALNNLSGETSPIPCLEDSFALHPLYGHPLQAGIWLQAAGSDEITRIYVILIPAKDRWQIGAWVVQQWTHTGKDFTTWFEQGKALVLKHDDLAAWLQFDLAEKLLGGGKFIVFPAAKEVAAERNKLFGGKSLIDILSPKFANDKLVYTASLLSRKGVALLLRFQIPGEWSSVAIMAHCRAKLKTLAEEPWMKAMAGIRCSYVVPSESKDREGVLGGIFLDQASLDQPATKPNGG
jgi:hypothetical protein